MKNTSKSHLQNPAEKAAFVALRLSADSGFLVSAKYRISANQWGDILAICEDKDGKYSTEEKAA